MPIPDVMKDRLDQALKEFDQRLRNDPAWQGWEASKSQKYAIVANGLQYPPKQIVSLATGTPVEAFSGGDQTNQYLRDRGFEVTTLKRRAIADLLEKILADYPTARVSQPFSGQAPMYKTFETVEHELRNEEALALHSGITVVASPGKGNWNKVPWIAFLDPRETTSTQEGVYVVILFRQDGSGLYLTLNQGVTKPKTELGTAAGIAAVKKKAAELRQAPYCQLLANEGFHLDDSIDLKADPGLGKDYEASTIAHKLYPREAIPDDSQLLADLDSLLSAYDRFLPKRDAMPPIHLLLKWNANREAKTIDLHRKISDAKGFVWWGKFGAALGQEKVSQLRQQVASGIPTWVYLVGGDTTWRARLLDITADAASVDDEHFPSYYTREDCTAFFRLSNFEEMGTPWLVANTVVDSNPVQGSTASILSSQQSFAYLRSLEAAWIFQANPDLFDVRGAVKELKQFRWLAKQHAAKMKKGDRVYLWESGSTGGIVGVAEILEPVESTEDDPASLPFRRQADKFQGAHPRVLLAVRQPINPPLARATIKNDPVLRTLPIFAMAQATNYPVTDIERQRLDKLLIESSSDLTKELCLIGTWRGVAEAVSRVRKALQERGGWASPWSFPIKAEAEDKLKRPFYLYLNAGGGRIPVRLRVTDYVTSQGNEGRVSPWPQITDDDWRGRTRGGNNPADIFKTWLRVDEITELSPELKISDFVPAEGLSVDGSLLHAMTFGYAHLRVEDPMDALVDLTLLDRAVLEEIVAALELPADKGGSPQLVLAGPPGTGKTWVAEAIAQHVTQGKERVRLVQFHPNYSYEAFVEGLRPVANGGAIDFRLQHGALMTLVDDMVKAQETDTNSPLYVIVIDEMNRANLPRVFGELMYLFEYRGKNISLQYSGNFSLPPNLRFIGTMNTADRSIRSIDIAMRRRFDVFELGPDSAVLRRFFQKHPLNVPNLIDGFEKLNAQLEQSLDRHHTIGHTFFMRPGLDRPALRAIWDRKIYPLIEEYFFDQLDIAKKDYTLDTFWPE